MRRIALPAFTMIAMVGLGAQADAQAPCPELARLRNASLAAWQQATRAPLPVRCGALYQASVAAEDVLDYAKNNRESCGVSDELLNDVEEHQHVVVEARRNVCAGRPLRPFPADIIQR